MEVAEHRDTVLRNISLGDMVGKIMRTIEGVVVVPLVSLAVYKEGDIG